MNEYRLSDMNSKKNIAIFVLVVSLVICSYFFLDARIALFVKKILIADEQPSIFSADIPDVLLPIVSVITIVAGTAYFTLSRKGIYNIHTRFFLLIAVTTPLSFFLKSILKHAIGRINARFWLLHPAAVEFRWFQGQENYMGFPSGHIAVFSVLVFALGTYYPRDRYVSFGCLFAMALALIATDYHFLSDIIAGVYLGYIIHAGTLYCLTVLERSNRGNKITN
jgi:hypothetical protein